MKFASARISERYSIFLLLILSSLLYLYGLGNRDMITRNESEAALAGLDIIETGRVMAPHFFGTPFVDNRPPGAFWLVAASFKLTGSSDEWAARLPSAAAAIICVLMVYAIGRRAANPAAGYISAMILMGMLGFALQARMSQENLLLTLWTLLCYWAFWRSLDEKQHAFRYALAFQVFMGFAALTKGPAAVINVAPLAAYVLYSRRWHEINWRAYMITLPVGLFLMFGWYVYIWIEWPSMREVLISRFTKQSDLHVFPFYYYLLALPELLGLALIFLPVLFLGWRKATPEEKKGPLGLFLVGAVGMFLLYHLFPSKRVHYIVPILPGLSIAFGLMIEKQKYMDKRHVGSLFLAFATLGPLLVLVWIYLASSILEIGVEGSDWLLLAIAACCTSLIWMCYRKGHHRMVVHLFWAGAIVLLAFILGGVFPRVDNQRSTRRFAEAVALAVPAASRLGTLTHHAALPYYAKRAIERVYLPDAERFLENPDTYLIGFDDDLDSIKNGNQRIVLSQPLKRRYDLAFLLHGGEGRN